MNNNLENILFLFLIILIGFLAKKTRLVSDQARPVLSQFVLNVAMPFLILDSMMFDYDPQMLKNSMTILGIAIVVYAVAILISELSPRLWKLPPSHMASYHFGMVLPNTGFLGLPLLRVTYGAEAAFYGTMIHLVFIALNWTYGVYVFTRDEGSEVKLKDLINPSILSLFLGFLLFLLPIRLPNIVLRTISSMSHTASPLTMFIIGMMLTEIRFKELFMSLKPVILALYRNVLFPLAVYFVLKSLHFSGPLLYVPTVIFGMPVAANTAIFAQGYGKDYQTATKVVLVSTVLALLTIPLLVEFVGMG
ncbi:MAG TPA: AEC family transporter [Tissierellia bacterium]|nr:AEC family transporter [Tissierellia bacterium]